jgi:hypothetical protein
MGSTFVLYHCYEHRTTEARAFGISGDRTQNLLYRLCNGELSFRHPPGVVVLCVGTNNLGKGLGC